MKYLICLVVVLVCGCDGQNKVQEPPEPPSSTAIPSNSQSRFVLDDPKDEALATLSRDAFRRENRFLDALTPGYLAQSTRVYQHDIRSNLFSVDELYRIGGQLFDLSFTHKDGLGTKAHKNFRRVHKNDEANVDATRCSACHWRGGEAGAGDAADNVYFHGDGDRPSSALERNPPSLAGAGILELAARSLTIDLKLKRQELINFAQKAGYAVRESLVAQGIHFGYLTVHPDGTVETKEVVGVDDDLMIKPFGRKGRFANIRDMVEESFFAHHGLQSTWMVKNWPRKRLGPGPSTDPDGDGVEEEILEGQVTALTLYLAMQGIPTIDPPEDINLTTTWARGRNLFSAIGCAQCHVPDIALKSTIYRLNDRDSRSTIEIDLAKESSPPRLGQRIGEDSVIVRLFSDLKRHKMGPHLAEKKESHGVAADEFLTPPLWGLARSRPYLHDGRAPTIDDAILLHGGEAQRSNDAFQSLSEVDRGALRVFLMSLNRAPRFTVR